FNPVATGKERRLEVKLDRVDFWLSKGAKASDRVAELVSKQRKQPLAA
ncbi:MAG: 30S ribosomal protein S16, partial [Steroidobacteraceae bacterium]